MQVPPQQRRLVPQEAPSGTGTPVSLQAPVETCVQPMSQGFPGAVTWHCEVAMQQLGPAHPPLPSSQAAWPAGQCPHFAGTPAPSHVSSGVHAMPQPRQLALSLMRSVQIPPQISNARDAGPHAVVSGAPGQTQTLLVHVEVHTPGPGESGIGQDPQVR
ncbi:MAG: hypothetical protein M3O46_05320 [Myxococcota bacterium]|nr:hypothetical protein [Myxococcota bacterium]